MVSVLEEEPRTYKDAIVCSESNFWKHAMKEELDSMRKNGVWELVDPPNNRKAIGSKWIF